MGRPISLKKDLIEFHNMFLKGLEESQEEENSIEEKNEDKDVDENVGKNEEGKDEE